MAIECVRFEKGHPIGSEGLDFERPAVMAIVNRHGKDRVQTLLPGEEIDLAPQLRRSGFAHMLSVHDDGQSGTYHRLLSNKEVVCKIHLPQDQSWVAVLGPSSDGYSIASIYAIAYLSLVTELKSP